MADLYIATAERYEHSAIFIHANPSTDEELARMTERAGPNLLRTLAKLEAFGLIEMHTVNRRRVPVAKLEKLRVEIDPYAMTDRIELVPSLHPV
jgi:predicted transcriptional regulator